MGKSKKTASKKTEAKKVDEGTVEARPIGHGKDPLAEGNTLVNPTNTEAETHYDVKEKSKDVQAAENTINGQDANQRAEQHNAQAALPHDTPNADQDEQDEAAEGREEPDEGSPVIEPEANAVDDTPEEVDVPERTEEQEAADGEEREKAVHTALKTTDKP